MGSSRQREVQTGRVENTMTMDPGQESQWNNLLGHIQNQTYQPYMGDRVAGPNANQQAAWQAAQGIGGLGQDQLAAASQAAQAAAGYSPQQVAAGKLQAAQSGATPMASAGQVGNIANINAQQVGQGQLTGGTQAGYDQLRGNVRDVQGGVFGNLSPYMNEYNNQVVNTALGDVERSRQMATNQTGDSAAAAGAFGGARHGVAESLTNSEFARTAARTAADLRARGFDTAAALQQQDLNRGLQAAGMNQGADQNVLGMTGNMASQTAFNNQNAALRAGMSNQSTQLARGQTNAQLSTQASLANAANALNNNQFNASSQNQIGMANQRAGLTAGMANQQAGLQGNAQQLQSAGLLGNLGLQAQNMGMNGMNALGWAGGQQYGIDQAGLDANYQNYLNQQGWNQQQTQNWMQTQAAMPRLVNTRQSQFETQTSSPWWQQALGAGLGIAGTALGGPIGGAIGGMVGNMVGGGGYGSAGAQIGGMIGGPGSASTGQGGGQSYFLGNAPAPTLWNDNTNPLFGGASTQAINTGMSSGNLNSGPTFDPRNYQAKGQTGGTLPFIGGPMYNSVGG